MCTISLAHRLTMAAPWLFPHSPAFRDALRSIEACNVDCRATSAAEWASRRNGTFCSHILRWFVGPPSSRRLSLSPCCPWRSRRCYCCHSVHEEAPKQLTAQHSTAPQRVGMGAAEVSPTQREQDGEHAQPALEQRPCNRLSAAMRYLVAARVVAPLLSSAMLLAALPSGRYMGSDHNIAAPLHASDDVFVDEHLQKLWDAAPPSHYHSPPRMAALNLAQTVHSAPNTLEPVEHLIGHAAVHHTAHSPPHHHSDSPPVSESYGSSPNGESSWSISDLHLLSPMQWDSPPSSRQHSPLRMAAPDHEHTGGSGSSAFEPASKRVKKHHAVDSQGPGTDAQSSWSPPGHHLGSPKQRSTATAAAPRSTPKALPKTYPLMKSNQLELPKLGLTVTAKAHPQEVEEALHAANVRLKPKSKLQKVHRTSILRMAVTSVSDGCTNKLQYIECMKEKYGKHLVKSHNISLGRWINKDMKDKGTFGLETSKEHAHTADGNDKRFTEEKRAQQNPLWLKLPPAGRKEPPVRVEDVREYQERIKHLDPHRLSPGEYIKQAYRHLEEAPDRWHKKIPKEAIDCDLLSKNVSEDMFNQFQKTHEITIRNVSIVLERAADCTTHGTDNGEQARMRQLYRKSSKDRATRSLAAKIRRAKKRAAKTLAAPPSHPGPH